MKEERKEAIGIIIFGPVCAGIVLILFLFQAHYRLEDLIDRIFGVESVIGSILKIPISLAWIVVYGGGFFGGLYAFLMGVMQLITGKSPKDQQKSPNSEADKNDEQSAPADADKPHH